MVLPVEVPGAPNLTWTVTKPVAAGAQIDGFAATTRVSAMVQGQYSAQVTRQSPDVQCGAGTPSGAPIASKQALIGALPTPSFLANVKITRASRYRTRAVAAVGMGPSRYTSAIPAKIAAAATLRP